MKRNLPIWLISFIILTITIFCTAGYVYSKQDDSKVSLVTCTGSPSILDGIEMNLDTLLSNEEDVLYTKINLGKDISVTSAYKDSYFYSDSNSYFTSKYISVSDSLFEAITSNEYEFTNQTLLYGDHYDSIPFSLAFNLNYETYKYSFPYIDLTIPEDMKISYSSLDGYTDINYSFDLDTTNPVKIDDIYYFTVTDMNIFKDSSEITGEDIEYTVNSGIFAVNNKTLTQVYDYPFTNDRSCRILDLVSFDDTNKLGLLVKENSSIVLKLFDLSSNTVVKEITLDDVPVFKDTTDYNTADYTLYYNSSSKTFVVKLYITETDLSDEELDQLNKAYITDNTSVINQLDSQINYYTSYICYTFDSDSDFAYHMSLNDADTLFEDFYSKEAENLLKYGMNGCDFIYKDNTLYLLSFYDDYSYSLPSICAVKDGSVIYAGYIKTNIEDDYKSPNTYYQSNDLSSEQEYYDLFATQQRYISSTSFSLKNQ